MALSYQIVYKKGVDNKVSDALSRVSQAPSYDISAVSMARPLWLQEIQDSYTADPQVAKLLSELSISSPIGLHSLKDGIIRYKERIWVGSQPVLQSKILSSLHANAIGVTPAMKLPTKESNNYLHGSSSNSQSKTS